MIRSGEKARHFAGTDIYGAEFSTRSFGGDYLLLSFLRGATCPFCNLRFLELLNWEKTLLKERIIIYAIFYSSNEELLNNMEGVKPPGYCQIIADSDMVFHQLYETEQSYFGTLRTLRRISKMIDSFRKKVFSMQSIGDPPILPADLVLDGDGNVISSYYGKDYADNLDMEEIIQRIRS